MSYGGNIIFEDYDAYGEIRVIEDDTRRYLSFGPGDEQSACLKKDPALMLFDYTQAMLLGLVLRAPHKALCLGLGAGSLVTALHTHCKGVKIDVVELRPAVIAAAQRYFYLPQSKNIQLHTGDAGAFLQHHAGRYDLIFSDLFTQDGLAPIQLDETFLANCATHLKPEGWLIINFWIKGKQQYEARLQEILLERLQALFPEVAVCPTGEGNWVFFASPTPFGRPLASLKQEAEEWSRKLGYSLVKYLKQTES